MNEELALVLERIETLERTNRRLRRIGGTLLAVVVVVLVMGQTAPRATPATVVEAEEFRLVDSSGEVRGVWTAYADAGTVIMLKDAAGMPRIFWGVSGDGRTLLDLSAKDGKPRMSWQIGPDGSAGFRFSKEDGKTSGLWWVSQDGTTKLRLYDKDEQVIFEAPLIEADDRQDHFWRWLLSIFPLLISALC